MRAPDIIIRNEKRMLREGGRRAVRQRPARPRHHRRQQASPEVARRHAERQAGPVSAGSANTYYDEFPVVVGGIQIKTSTVIPLSTATSVPAVPAASVTSPNSITPANLVASLNLKYPANTIVTLAGTTLTSSDLDACSADFIQGGSCFGDLEITGTTILQDNLFVFGNINITRGRAPT